MEWNNMEANFLLTCPHLSQTRLEQSCCTLCKRKWESTQGCNFSIQHYGFLENLIQNASQSWALVWDTCANFSGIQKIFPNSGTTRYLRSDNWHRFWTPYAPKPTMDKGLAVFPARAAELQSRWTEGWQRDFLNFLLFSFIVPIIHNLIAPSSEVYFCLKNNSDRR